MRHAATLLLLCATSVAAGPPDAPTWSRPLITATVVHGAVRIADDAHTCSNLAHGGHEFNYPTQSCAGVVAWNTATFAGFTLLSYELARHGHCKLAVALQWVGAGTDAAWAAVPRR